MALSSTVFCSITPYALSHSTWDMKELRAMSTRSHAVQDIMLTCLKQYKYKIQIFQ